jgi:hypothetical protein
LLEKLHIARSAAPKIRETYCAAQVSEKVLSCTWAANTFTTNKIKSLPLVIAEFQ